jgi:hypothetical protein
MPLPVVQPVANHFTLPHVNSIYLYNQRISLHCIKQARKVSVDSLFNDDSSVTRLYSLASNVRCYNPEEQRGYLHRHRTSNFSQPNAFTSFTSRIIYLPVLSVSSNLSLSKSIPRRAVHCPAQPSPATAAVFGPSSNYVSEVQSTTREPGFRSSG